MCYTYDKIQLIIAQNWSIQPSIDWTVYLLQAVITILHKVVLLVDQVSLCLIYLANNKDLDMGCTFSL